MGLNQESLRQKRSGHFLVVATGQRNLLHYEIKLISTSIKELRETATGGGAQILSS